MKHGFLPFGPGDDPSVQPPSARGVRELGKQPALRSGRLEALLGNLARDLNLTLEHRISGQPTM